MKQLFSVTLFLFMSCAIQGQTNTDVYLFDLEIKGGEPVLSNPKNISNNDGYDNQPSFLNDNTVVYSATRNNQTDILRFNIEAGSTTSWITNTPDGSEYSPLKVPNKKAISAIRLDLDGLQRLYEYDIQTGDSKEILKDLKVGYHVWYNDHILVSTILVEGRMDLVVNNLKDGTNQTFQKNVGRSLWKIPDSDLISYISKEKEVWEIKSLNPVSGATKKITNTYKNAEDMCWLNSTIILAGAEKSVLKYDTSLDINWQPVITFKQDEINNISRIAVNPAGNRLAFVAEESPANIVQKQLDAYNARDIQAFMDTYSENVKLYEYPNTLFMEGQNKMKESYHSYFENTPDLNCQIKNRIVIGNKVIDEEYITANGSNFSAVAIYEVENGKIAKVTFLR
ncbi:nuclear transport factor 2 family protein [Flagellimonas sp. HMM57]|uniref:nuclear transport factor 2 family protein n=1 Tax=unclassified Flagellimonas TaxID=2644544 RepID=UPI0013D7225D|nr:MULTISPECIES: nuclear transport factor 2 family protein [unclassified Flagellimonas]UII75476.1 nuclear transport factor 2 family protein [Flagellimonas sp. HMM57]